MAFLLTSVQIQFDKVLSTQTVRCSCENDHILKKLTISICLPVIPQNVTIFTQRANICIQKRPDQMQLHKSATDQFLKKLYSPYPPKKKIKKGPLFIILEVCYNGIPGFKFPQL